MSLMQTQSAGTGWIQSDGAINLTVGTPGVSVSGLVFTLIGWFKTPPNTSSNFASLIAMGAGASVGPFAARFKNGATQGHLEIFYRPDNSTSSFTMLSTNAFDDNKWHWYVVQRTGNANAFLYVDQVNSVESSDTTSITTTFLSGITRIRMLQSCMQGCLLGPHWGTRRVLNLNLCVQIARGLAQCPSPTFLFDALSMDKLALNQPIYNYSSSNTVAPSIPFSSDHPIPLPTPSLVRSRLRRAA